ncbi:hypothetical protein Hypma_013446 [Hypsizygus marmoreus]|uniref:Uncharacterized protein n=1 Tax=Hypsizygus marmoreus TaxID=39966 RepID=A0A369JB35_HYPMA|nr:hypothetical protein Hypma_013446 [Hypsizygus marmoreus]
MPSVSVTPSHTSTKSKLSSKHEHSKTKHHSKHRHDKSESNGETAEKLVVKTADMRREPSIKTSSPRPELPGETLAVMIGGKVRRSRCAPEFLEEVAKGVSSEVFEDLGRKFKIITGSDAVAFYKKFLGGKSVADIIAAKEGAALGKESPSVVFAVSVLHAGRKLVDYYMTWRGKTRVKDVEERRTSFLDHEFRRVARSIDKEYKRISIYGPSASGSLSGSAKSFIRGQAPDPPEAAPAPKSRPPSILAPPPKLHIDPPSSPSRPPLSATDSVMSLPFLNMIRGVPLTHRVPLRVTNPDRLSMISTSSDAIQPPTPENTPQQPSRALETVVEQEESNQVTLPVDLNMLHAPEVVRTSSHSSGSSLSKDSPKSSAASIASSESHRSKRKDRKSESKEEDPSEFLIVLLDDKIDKNSRTWHGLERQVSRQSTRTTPNRVSAWDGPLARDNGITYRTPPIRSSPAKGEESSSDEEEWENSPVIPVQAYMLASMRAASEPNTRLTSPVVPARAQYMLAMGANSPMVSVGNLGYTVPRNSGSNSFPSSPYMPSAYASPYQTPNMPVLRPLSRSTYSGYPSSYAS